MDTSIDVGQKHSSFLETRIIALIGREDVTKIHVNDIIVKEDGLLFMLSHSVVLWLRYVTIESYAKGQGVCLQPDAEDVHSQNRGHIDVCFRVRSYSLVGICKVVIISVGEVPLRRLKNF